MNKASRPNLTPRRRDVQVALRPLEDLAGDFGSVLLCELARDGCVSVDLKGTTRMREVRKRRDGEGEEWRVERVWGEWRAEGKEGDEGE